MATCQQKNGRKARDPAASAIVPPSLLLGQAPSARKAQAQPVAPMATPEAQPAPTRPYSPSPRVVYKGGTPAVPGVHTGLKLEHPLCTPCASLVHPLYTALGRLGPSSGCWEGRGCARDEPAGVPRPKHALGARRRRVRSPANRSRPCPALGGPKQPRPAFPVPDRPTSVWSGKARKVCGVA